MFSGVVDGLLHYLPLLARASPLAWSLGPLTHRETACLPSTRPSMRSLPPATVSLKQSRQRLQSPRMRPDETPDDQSGKRSSCSNPTLQPGDHTLARPKSPVPIHRKPTPIPIPIPKPPRRKTRCIPPSLIERGEEHEPADAH